MKKIILLIMMIFSVSITNAQIRKVKNAKKSRIDRIDIPISNTQSATNLRQDCCPPWNEEIIKDNTRIITSPYGGINANYTVKFNATPTLRNQMQAYLNYAHAMNPSINAIIINFRMHKQGADTCDGGYGPQVGNEQFATWHANNPSAYQAGNFWTGYNLEVGVWYKLHTGIYLNDGNIFFDSDCADNSICIRIQIKNGMQIVETNVNGMISEEKISKLSFNRTSVRDDDCDGFINNFRELSDSEIINKSNIIKSKKNRYFIYKGRTQDFEKYNNLCHQNKIGDQTNISCEDSAYIECYALGDGCICRVKQDCLTIAFKDNTEIVPLIEINNNTILNPTDLIINKRGKKYKIIANKELLNRIVAEKKSDKKWIELLSYSKKIYSSKRKKRNKNFNRKGERIKRTQF